MALTREHEDIRRAIARLDRDATPETAEDLSRRLDALVEAVEILARDRYEFPGLPESNLRSAIWRAKRRSVGHR
jgi:hypothetical protein